MVLTFSVVVEWKTVLTPAALIILRTIIISCVLWYILLIGCGVGCCTVYSIFCASAQLASWVNSLWLFAQIGRRVTCRITLVVLFARRPCL